MELNIPVKYRKDIDIATNLLKNEGCQSIYLFGSLVTGKNHDNSDIDIGIKGLPEGKFFETCSKLKWNEMGLLVNNLEEIWKIVKEDFELFIKNN